VDFTTTPCCQLSYWSGQTGLWWLAEHLPGEAAEHSLDEGREPEKGPSAEW